MLFRPRAEYSRGMIVVLNDGKYFLLQGRRWFCPPLEKKRQWVYYGAILRISSVGDIQTSSYPSYVLESQIQRIAVD